MLSNLPPGPYRLQISLRGFTLCDRIGIVLHVATSNVIDAVLMVGGVVEKAVTVEGARPLVDT